MQDKVCCKKARENNPKARFSSPAIRKAASPAPPLANFGARTKRRSSLSVLPPVVRHGQNLHSFSFPDLWSQPNLQFAIEDPNRLVSCASNRPLSRQWLGGRLTHTEYRNPNQAVGGQGSSHLWDDRFPRTLTFWGTLVRGRVASV